MKHDDLIERINTYMGVDDGPVREVMPSYSVRVPASFLDECRLEIERLSEALEPVAYRHWCECDVDDNGNPIYDWEYFDKASCHECQPLYTTTPSIDALIAELDKYQNRNIGERPFLSEIIDKYRSTK